MGEVVKQDAKQIINYVNDIIKEYEINIKYDVNKILYLALTELSQMKDSDGKYVLNTPAYLPSIKASLLKMVMLELNPARKECYFINYGGKIELQTSAFGKKNTLVKKGGIEYIITNVVYKGDVLELGVENSFLKIIKHETKPENRQNEIVGAYCIVKTDKFVYTEYMTYKDIYSCWLMSPRNTVTKAHKMFPAEMARKTVCNRALKHLDWYTGETIMGEEDIVFEKEIYGAEDDDEKNTTSEEIAVDTSDIN